MNIRMPTIDATWPSVAGITAPTEPVLRIWALALATYAVGDGVTTAMLVWVSPVYVEANPVVRAAIDAFGASGLVGVKVIAISTCFAFSLWGSTDGDQFMFHLPPVTLILAGTAMTLFNASLLW